jgi:hypothetical protein
MAKLSQNISNLVFRRNIPFKLETYVLNCEMLEVLVEIDGIKTVAAIAALLNKSVDQLINPFATLYQQKLIFLLKPNPAIAAKPHSETLGSLYRENYSKRIPSVSMTPPKENLITKQPSSSPKYRLAGGRSASVDGISSDLSAKCYHRRFEYTEKMKNAVGRLPAGLPLRAELKRSYRRRELFGFQTADRKILSKEPSAQKDGTGFLDNSSSLKLPEYQTTDRISLRHCQKATDYFEKGLAFLKRHSYLEALRHFRLSLALDPNNRLCRANIQRIQKILKGDSKLSPKLS